MKVAADGKPEVGPSARTLGVRPGDLAPHNDVEAIRPTDPVGPGQGGLSVAPYDPLGLPRARRPIQLGGVGRDPVWVLDLIALPPRLASRFGRMRRLTV